MVQRRLTRYFFLLALLVPAAQAFSQTLEVIYRNPEMSLANYDTIFLDDLNIASAKMVPPAWVEGADRNPTRWEIKPEGVKAMQKAFRAAADEHIAGNGGYKIVSAPEAKALEVTVYIISLTPYALPEDEVVTKGTGELTMQVTLRDSITNKLVAILEGPQQVGEAYHERTDLTALDDLKSLFDDWGKRLRGAMDESHKQ
ncbi:DUF3313 family protein [Pseudomaricurvus sp. HS19]|uniref:DUF3313 family protein n=1 Tax=Pseudomaricurvus sp. HS19 TaxID=2692626 RepID=UPI00136CA6D1|nr:DUF3313 family protein [Pseudomaricurvus sp. HS19]MYM62356.1 DUF3313 family protein [Pseudomaricurvus sp. HS19]